MHTDRLGHMIDDAMKALSADFDAGRYIEYLKSFPEESAFYKLGMRLETGEDVTEDQIMINAFQISIHRFALREYL